MSKPWLETWFVSTGEALARSAPEQGPQEWAIIPTQADTDDDNGRLHLAAAAPALVRALLAVEWEEPAPEDGDRAFCVECRSWRDEGHGTAHPHICTVDAALTAAGLPDQASRDEARKEIDNAGRR